MRLGLFSLFFVIAIILGNHSEFDAEKKFEKEESCSETRTVVGKEEVDCVNTSKVAKTPDSACTPPLSRPQTPGKDPKTTCPRARHNGTILEMQELQGSHAMVLRLLRPLWKALAQGARSTLCRSTITKRLRSTAMASRMAPRSSGICHICRMGCRTAMGGALEQTTVTLKRPITQTSTATARQEQKRKEQRQRQRKKHTEREGTRTANNCTCNCTRTALAITSCASTTLRCTSDQHSCGDSASAASAGPEKIGPRQLVSRCARIVGHSGKETSADRGQTPLFCSRAIESSPKAIASSPARQNNPSSQLELALACCRRTMAGIRQRLCSCGQRADPANCTSRQESLRIARSTLADQRRSTANSSKVAETQLVSDTEEIQEEPDTRTETANAITDGINTMVNSLQELQRRAEDLLPPAKRPRREEDGQEATEAATPMETDPTGNKGDGKHGRLGASALQPFAKGRQQT